MQSRPFAITLPCMTCHSFLLFFNQHTIVYIPMPRTSLSRIAIPSARGFSTCHCRLDKHDDTKARKVKTASEHLFTLAETEEAIENAILKAQSTPKSDVAWTGEESVKDQVLRMLIDSQSAPMRVPGWKKSIQQPTVRPLSEVLAEEREVRASTSKLPADDEPIRYPKPWEATYRAPRCV